MMRRRISGFTIQTYKGSQSLLSWMMRRRGRFTLAFLYYVAGRNPY